MRRLGQKMGKIHLSKEVLLTLALFLEQAALFRAQKGLGIFEILVFCKLAATHITFLFILLGYPGLQR